ncbi:MAG TPA: hypothetical protein VM778_15155 [Gemmatimonadota bacterium]|nr:hypothetical protein [Gemmatimonadota bacterium]
MKPSLNIDDEVIRGLERRAVETGRTISLLEKALRLLLASKAGADAPYRLRWNVVPDGVFVGVDLDDRNSLIDRLGESAEGVHN